MQSLHTFGLLSKQPFHVNRSLSVRTSRQLFIEQAFPVKEELFPLRKCLTPMKHSQLDERVLQKLVLEEIVLPDVNDPLERQVMIVSVKNIL